jgi:hypothetical protein
MSAENPPARWALQGHRVAAEVSGRSMPLGAMQVCHYW